MVEYGFARSDCFLLDCIRRSLFDCIGSDLRDLRFVETQLSLRCCEVGEDGVEMQEIGVWILRANPCVT